MHIYRSSRPEPLRLNRLQATVGAEWDTEVVWGDILTLRQQHNLCLTGNCTERLAAKKTWVFGVRHLDLGTLAGISATLGCKPQNDHFWNLAHIMQKFPQDRIEESLEDLMAVASLSPITAVMYSSWVTWQKMNPVPDTHEGAIQDVTAEYHKALEAIYDLTVIDYRG